MVRLNEDEYGVRFLLREKIVLGGKISYENSN